MSIVAQSLADGQLANAKAAIYTVPVAKTAHITTLILANADTSDHFIYVYLKRSGGTSRLLFSSPLPVNSYFEFPDESKGLKLSTGDALEAYADVAATVDYTITGGLE